jgi:tetratricopeptide (TPR) repeat protein
MKLRIALPLLALLGSTTSGLALAQDAATADPGITVRLQGGQPADEDVVDEALLRYLASRGDRAAADAEIKRLQELHPGWQPPPDLFGGAPAVDEGPLWELYETGDYAQVRARIEAIRKERPDWDPPVKLLSLMEINETRALAEAAAGRGDWQAVVSVLQERPAAATCENIDNLWRLAEGQKRTGDEAGAMATYVRIVTTCPNPDHRFATLQKAKVLMPAPELERLVAMEKAKGGDAGQLARLDTLTARPAAKGKGQGKPAVRSGPDFSRIYRPTANVADARAVADQVIGRKDGVAARKIGWIYQAAGDTAAALPWFKRGMDWAPGAESAKGLAMALAALGQDDGLDALAASYPAIVTEARGGEVAVAAAQEDLPRVLRLTRRSGDPGDLLLRSWTLMKLMRPTEAQLTFIQVMALPRAEPLQRDDAIYGLARAQIAQHLFREAARTIERYGLPPEKQDEVQAELLSQEVQVAFAQKDYRRTVALLEKRRDYAQPDRGLEIQEAWARYHVGEVQTARRIFTRLDRIVSTPETEAGLDAVSRKMGPGY